MTSGLPLKLVKNLPAMQETLVWFLGWEDPLEKGWLPAPLFLGFPCGSVGKESACNVGDLGSIRVLGRSPGEGKGYLLQYSGLENSMDCIVYGVAKTPDTTERLSLSQVISYGICLSLSDLLHLAWSSLFACLHLLLNTYIEGTSLNDNDPPLASPWAASSMKGRLPSLPRSSVSANLAWSLVHGESPLRIYWKAHRKSEHPLQASSSKS